MARRSNRSERSERFETDGTEDDKDDKDTIDAIDTILDFPSLVVSFLESRRDEFTAHIREARHQASFQAAGRNGWFDHATASWIGIDEKGRDKVLRRASDEELAFQDEIRDAARWLHSLRVRDAEMVLDGIRGEDAVASVLTCAVANNPSKV